MPTPADDRQEQVVEALVERQQLGGLRFLGASCRTPRGCAGVVQVSDSIVKM